MGARCSLLTDTCLTIGLALLISSCSPEPLKEKLSDLIEEFIYTSLSNSPVTATQVGYHKHGAIELDSQLDDFSPAALDKQRRWYQDLRLRLQRSVDPKCLTPEDRADLEIIHDQISLALLELQSIQNYRHNPTLYVELIGNALYSPFVLEYTDKSEAISSTSSNDCRLFPAFCSRRESISLAPPRSGRGSRSEKTTATSH